jgi:hypothetical protein
MARGSKTVADWSRRLPRPIIIPKVMTVATLADVRTLMRHLPAGMSNGRNGVTSPPSSPRPPLVPTRPACR